MSAPRAKELGKDVSTLVAQHTRYDFRPVIEPGVPEEVTHRPGHARLLVPRTEHDPVHPGKHGRTGAHPWRSVETGERTGRDSNSRYRVNGMPVFETGAFNHSATCPAEPTKLVR